VAVADDVPGARAEREAVRIDIAFARRAIAGRIPQVHATFAVGGGREGDEGGVAGGGVGGVAKVYPHGAGNGADIFLERCRQHAREFRLRARYRRRGIGDA
jgi:hypothetical protein